MIVETIRYICDHAEVRATGFDEGLDEVIRSVESTQYPISVDQSDA